jgi:hypothetical protein
MLHGQHVQAPTRIALVAAVNPADPQHSTGIADENPAIRRSMQGYWGPSEQFRQCGTQRAQCPSFMTSEPISHGQRGSTTRYCLHDFNTARIVVWHITQLELGPSSSCVICSHREGYPSSDCPNSPCGTSANRVKSLSSHLSPAHSPVHNFCTSRGNWNKVGIQVHLIQIQKRPSAAQIILI